MLVDTDNLVTADEFRKELEKYITAARQGKGPVAVTQNAEVVGFFISREEYEAMYGAAVKELLAARASGPTVSHQHVRAHLRGIVKRAKNKS